MAIVTNLVEKNYLSKMLAVILVSKNLKKSDYEDVWLIQCRYWAMPILVVHARSSTI